jgi:GTP-binding protein
VDVELVRDAAHPREFPEDGLPEIALVGRSNAGKSTLLNALVGRHRLARTSSTPGKTRRIHFYRVQRALYLVDLPGYGYATGSREERAEWRPIVQGYLGAGRGALRGVVLLTDVRRGVSDDERDLIAWLAAHGVPARVALSKADKLGHERRGRAVQRAETALTGLGDVAVAALAARTGLGMGAIAEWVRDWSDVGLVRPDGRSFSG